MNLCTHQAFSRLDLNILDQFRRGCFKFIDPCTHFLYGLFNVHSSLQSFSWFPWPLLFIYFTQFKLNDIIYQKNKLVNFY